MCDSDDQGYHGRSGMDLTGFLFGNIDESGQLEDEGLLDGESKKMLSSLNRLGFGSMLSEVLDEDEPNQDDEEKGLVLLTILITTKLILKLKSNKTTKTGLTNKNSFISYYNIYIYRLLRKKSISSRLFRH